MAPLPMKLLHPEKRETESGGAGAASSAITLLRVGSTEFGFHITGLSEVEQRITKG